MLILSLTVVAREPVRLREAIPADHLIWREAEIALNEPLGVDLEARMVGEGVLVRGEVWTEVAAECRRCLAPVAVPIRDRVDLLFEPLSADEQAELSGEVYPLPERGDELDLAQAVREQIVLRIPDFVVCAESCLGFCPHCGAELNRMTCNCAPEETSGPWDVLKGIKFD